MVKFSIASLFLINLSTGHEQADSISSWDALLQKLGIEIPPYHITTELTASHSEESNDSTKTQHPPRFFQQEPPYNLKKSSSSPYIDTTIPQGDRLLENRLPKLNNQRSE